MRFELRLFALALLLLALAAAVGHNRAIAGEPASRPQAASSPVCATSPACSRRAWNWIFGQFSRAALSSDGVRREHRRRVHRVVGDAVRVGRR